MITEHFFSDRHELVLALNEHLVVHLKQALAHRNHASMVVPGGSTPIPLFDLLAQDTLDWSKITLVPSDERWLAADHPDSNEGVIRSHFLSKTQAHFISLCSGVTHPEAGETRIRQRLQQLSWPTDICLLGMGEDGHVASLFADAPEFNRGIAADNQDLCLAIRPGNVAHTRMSLTLNALLNTREIIILIHNDAKKKIYLSARANATQITLPVGHILHRSHVPVHIYWAA